MHPVQTYAWIGHVLMEYHNSRENMNNIPKVVKLYQAVISTTALPSPDEPPLHSPCSLWTSSDA